MISAKLKRYLRLKGGRVSSWWSSTQVLPQGSKLETILCNIVISGQNNGTKCTLNQLLDDANSGRAWG